MGCCPINHNPEEFESKDKDDGAAGNLGRLPAGGDLELGLEGGRDGMDPWGSPVSSNPSAYAGCGEESFMEFLPST